MNRFGTASVYVVGGVLVGAAIPLVAAGVGLFVVYTGCLLAYEEVKGHE